MVLSYCFELMELLVPICSLAMKGMVPLVAFHGLKVWEGFASLLKCFQVLHVKLSNLKSDAMMQT